MTKLIAIPRQSHELLFQLSRLGLAAAAAPRASALRSAPVAGPSSRPHKPFPKGLRSFTTSTSSRLATEVKEEAVVVASESTTVDSASVPTAAVPPPAVWTSKSRRVGLIARKRGMVTYFLPNGEAIPCTVLQVDDCQVSAHIGFAPAKPYPTHDDKGQPLRIPKIAAYTALQIAAGEVTSNRGIGKTRKGHLAKAGIKTQKRILKEFKISTDAVLPLGTTLSASHFVPGQDVDVSSTSRGKGFQGVMKRHGFSGLRASHGTSIKHRSGGSTGQNSDPSRVWPGTKMAGRMGGQRATVHNLKVLRIDLDRELILVKGPLPGPDGGVVEVTDARRSLIWKAVKKNRIEGVDGAEALPEGIDGLPFPAGTKEMNAGLPRILEWAGPPSAAPATTSR